MIHFDMVHIVKVARPNMLQHLLNGDRNKILHNKPYLKNFVLYEIYTSHHNSEEVGIVSHKSILFHDKSSRILICHFTQEFQHEKLSAFAKNMEQSDSSSDDEMPFPQVQPRKTGRKVIACPKLSCGKIYIGGFKQRLLHHIRSKHPKEKNELIKKALTYYPCRDKTPRIQCCKCGKLIAGRAAQMRIHQESKGCS